MQSNFAVRLSLSFFFAVIAFAFLIVGESPSNLSPAFYSLALSVSLFILLLPQFAIGFDKTTYQLVKVKTALSCRLDVPRKEKIQRHDPFLI